MLTLALSPAEKGVMGYVYNLEELNVKSIKTGKAANPHCPFWEWVDSEGFCPTDSSSATPTPGLHSVDHLLRWSVQ